MPHSLSDDGFALMAELLANDELDVDAILDHVLHDEDKRVQVRGEEAE